MRGWTQLVSDVNWIDYHGMWCKQAKDGAWYVLVWTNLLDAGGKEFADTPYEIQVKRLDLRELTEKNIQDCLNSCGPDPEAMNEYDAKTRMLALLESAISYGFGAPLFDKTSNKYPQRLRAEGVRKAKEFMKDAHKLQCALDRPVNRIGMTAQQYGLGLIHIPFN